MKKIVVTTDFSVNSKKAIYFAIQLTSQTNAELLFYNVAGLVRAENVWFPTNLLPSEKVRWTVINANSAKLAFQYNGISFYYTVTFNGIGGITEMGTQRFMTDKKRETWLCRMADYKEINYIKIPVSAEAIWKLLTGDYSYAKFEVQKIKYNNYHS